MLLALIFAVGFSGPDSSRQLFSTMALVAGIAAACWIGARLTRSRLARDRSAPDLPRSRTAPPARLLSLPYLELLWSNTLQI